MNDFQEQEFTKRFDLPVWKKAISYAREYKGHILKLIFVMLIVGAVDVMFPLLTRYAVDHFVENRTLDGIGIYIAVFLFVVLFQGINVLLLIRIGGKVEAGVTKNLRKATFEHLQKLSFSYYDKTPAGWIMARVLSDIRHVSMLISWGLVDTTWGFALMVTATVVMFLMNAKLAAIVICVMPLLIIISLLFQKRILAWQRKIRKTNSNVTASFNEGLMGAKTSKTLVIEEDNISGFKDLTNEMYIYSMKAVRTSGAYFPVISVLGVIGTAMVIYFGGNSVMDMSISLGTLIAFLNYTYLFYMPVMDFARTFATFQQAQAGAERIIGLISTEPDVKDKPEVESEYGTILNPKKAVGKAPKGDIEFKKVNFYYKPKEPILTDFDLDIKAGEKVALVGETGSGKSTIVNLICRFYEPVSGSILIDGIDYSDRPISWLHSNIGYVLQSPHLFSGTIADNIRYGRKNSSIEEVIEASKLVNAHSFIMKLKDGYDTHAGEGGSLLSTGEKQLISFARAVLPDPALFILDEATSSIDTQTEHIIQEAIEKVLKNRTSIIIAHRLSTIKNCDRIIMIEEGEILEMGSHHELINKKGRYYKLYTNQYIDEHEISLLQSI